MKYTVETIIEQDINLIIERFQDPDGISKWQRGFLSMEHLSGTAGEVGAKSKMRFKQGKREMEITETITAKNLPDSFTSTYETKGVWNEVISRFEAIDAKKVKYSSEVEFKMKGMLKLMGWIMPGMFKKQSKRYMEDFKHYAETGTSLF